MAPARPHFRRYVLSMMALVIGPLIAVGAFVFAVDPLWISPIDTGITRLYCVKDERQNKIDKARFDSARYDSVLLASSRGNSFDFGTAGYHTFNFALGGMFPFEYQPVLDLFARYQGEPKTVFLALDFYGTAEPTKTTDTDKPPQFFIERLADPFYRLRNTLSWQVLAYAASDVTSCGTTPGGYGVFDRTGRMHVGHLASLKEFFRRARANLNFYGRERYGVSYTYNAELKDMLKRLRDSHPHSRFVVFTTPESAPMWRLVIEHGRFDDYARWLGEIVEVFGEVHDFLGYNSVTTDYENFYDGHHLYPEIGRLVVKRVLDLPVSGHEDFGVRVTAENLADHIARQRSRGPTDISAYQLLSMRTPSNPSP
ncbi:MAG TPA: hypothetical protein VFA50_10415 [Stellaceae bacterium]|nr:hypothetical protein [Stellaceae bacterium]